LRQAICREVFAWSPKNVSVRLQYRGRYAIYDILSSKDNMAAITLEACVLITHLGSSWQRVHISTYRSNLYVLEVRKL